MDENEVTLEAEIENLQLKVNAAVGYLITLEQVAKERGTLDAHPVFADFTVRTMMEDYRELQRLRGY